MAADKTKDEGPVVIKKYPNRRLYNTETSVYVTLEDLALLVKEERDFIVQDAKTGEDLTRQVLTQIIMELEGQGNPMLPTHFLRNIIRMYDDGMQNVMQHYLNSTMQTFMNNQEKMRSYATKAIQGFSPISQFEEITRQNMQFFEKTFSMFNPFGGFNPTGAEEEDKNKKKK